MADVIFDPSNKNPKELLGQGIRAYVLQDYNTAVQALSRASELIVTETEDELHDSLGDVYLYYGKSLLEFSRNEAEPLGDAVPKGAEEDDEEEDEGGEGDEQEEEEESKPEDSEKDKEDSKAEGDSSSNAEAVEENKTVENGGDVGEAGPSGSAEEATEENEAEEDLPDLELAWSVLELAKKIFTARGDDGKKNLAETHVVLGEVSLESENFETAIDDIKKGLEIQKEIFSNDNRTLAETAYKLGIAFSTNAQIEEAIGSFKSSLEYLQNRVNVLEKSEESKEEEIQEIKSLIPDIEEKIADMMSCKEEAIKQFLSSMQEPKTNGSASASSSGAGPSKQATDISHLVKRKRKVEDLGDEKKESEVTSPPAKKPSP